MEIVTLTNGLRVANFSSPHDFTFVDGTVLLAQPANVAERLKVNFHETPVGVDNYTYELDFTISDDVLKEMRNCYEKWENDEIDFVLCPLPMIQAIRKTIAEEPTHSFDFNHIALSPFRCVRMPDRIKKLVAIDRFTV